MPINQVIMICGGVKILSFIKLDYFCSSIRHIIQQYIKADINIWGVGGRKSCNVQSDILYYKREEERA